MVLWWALGALLLLLLRVCARWAWALVLPYSLCFVPLASAHLGRVDVALARVRSHNAVQVLLQVGGRLL